MSTNINQADDQASDPTVLGWMQGYPPPPEKRITQPAERFFAFPELRWSVCHIRSLMPTVEINRGIGAPCLFPEHLHPEIDALRFTPSNSTVPMTWADALAVNYTDGILIIHAGQIIYERYCGALHLLGKHAAMSMTKSLTGLLAEILIQEGMLDEHAPIASLIPELHGSGFADATVRQVMNMTTALDFSECYSDPHAEIWQYTRAADPMPKPDDYQGPVGYCAYLQTVRKRGEHGQAFTYRTINSDVLGWVIARSSGSAVHDLLAERLWQRMDAEQDAYMTVDSIGTPFAGGGLSAGLRDLGRIGMLMLNEGVINGNRLFPATVVHRIKQGGDPRLFAQAHYPMLHHGRYQSMWWLFDNPEPVLAARGVHGQTIYIDPAANMVIVRFASHPQANNTANDPTSLPAYRAVSAYLRSIT